jgi:hypothetical protein
VSVAPYIVLKCDMTKCREVFVSQYSLPGMARSEASEELWTTRFSFDAVQDEDPIVLDFCKTHAHLGLTHNALKTVFR